MLIPILDIELLVREKKLVLLTSKEKRTKILFDCLPCRKQFQFIDSRIKYFIFLLSLIFLKIVCIYVAVLYA